MSDRFGRGRGVLPGCFIDGQRVNGAGPTLVVRSPWSADHVASLSSAGARDVSAAVESATKAFARWSKASIEERVLALQSFANLLDESAEELAELQVRENGKLYKEMLGQARQFGEHLRYYASLLRMPSGYIVQPPLGGMTVHTERMPLGVVAAITPWNSPLNLLLWKVGPALAAGNTVVVKPSEVTPLSTLRFAELAAEAGLPPGALNVVSGAGDIGKELVANSDIAKIAFTGSSAAGEGIAGSAATGLRRVSLELGGKSANVIFSDADQEQAVRGAVAGIFGASGQTCMAGSRILVQASCYEDFLERLTEYADNMVVGSPFDEASDMGSVASLAQLEKIESMVAEAVNVGACVRAGGKRAIVSSFPDGLFYRPTVLSDVTREMAIFREEVFGPVAVVLPFQDEDDAVNLANATEYGLAAAVWTNDRSRSDRVATALRAGTVWVNNYRKVAYNVPFGGTGMSGLGRENGHKCIDDYSEVKSVWIDRGLGVRDPFNPRADS